MLSLIGLAVLLPAFWVGHAAGARGRWRAYAGRNAASGARLLVAAFVVGVLSSIGWCATIYLIDFLGQPAIG